MYEQGRNLAYDGLPVNQALSMGVHESQSLLWERMVALGRPFCHYLLPKLKVCPIRALYNTHAVLWDCVRSAMTLLLLLKGVFRVLSLPKLKVCPARLVCFCVFWVTLVLGCATTRHYMLEYTCVVACALWLMKPYVRALRALRSWPRFETADGLAAWLPAACMCVCVCMCLLCVSHRKRFQMHSLKSQRRTYTGRVM